MAKSPDIIATIPAVRSKYLTQYELNLDLTSAERLGTNSLPGFVFMNGDLDKLLDKTCKSIITFDLGEDYLITLDEGDLISSVVPILHDVVTLSKRHPYWTVTLRALLTTKDPILVKGLRSGLKLREIDRDCTNAVYFFDYLDRALERATETSKGPVKIYMSNIWKRVRSEFVLGKYEYDVQNDREHVYSFNMGPYPQRGPRMDQIAPTIQNAWKSMFMTSIGVDYDKDKGIVKFTQ